MGEENKKNAWQMLERILNEFDERIKDLEDRLSVLEKGQAVNVLMDEKHIPEQRKGIVEGKRLTESKGMIERVITLPVCDVCGLRIGEKFIVCHKCGRKLCDECSISFENTYFCLECLREKINLPKRLFLVLQCVASEVTNRKKISELTKIPKEDVQSCIEELLVLGLIEKRGISIFSDYKITDDGMSVISAYKQAYTSDDVVQFYSELKKFRDDAD
jgi:predicted transcriptional regulator